MESYLKDYINYVHKLFKKGKLKKNNQELIDLMYNFGIFECYSELESIKDEINYLETNIEGIHYKIPYIKFIPEILDQSYPVFLISVGRTNIYSIYNLIKKISNKIGAIIYIYQHPGYSLSEPIIKSENTLYNAFEFVTDYLRNIHENLTLIGNCLSSFLVVKYLALHPEFSNKVALISLINDFPSIIFDDEKFKEIMKEHLYSTKDFLPLIKNQVVAYYSINDELISQDQSEQNFAFLNCEKTLIVLNSRRHRFLSDFCEKTESKLINMDVSDMSYLELVIRHCFGD